MVRIRATLDAAELSGLDQLLSGEDGTVSDDVAPEPEPESSDDDGSPSPSLVRVVVATIDEALWGMDEAIAVPETPSPRELLQLREQAIATRSRR